MDKLGIYIKLESYGYLLICKPKGISLPLFLVFGTVQHTTKLESSQNFSLFLKTWQNAFQISDIPYNSFDDCIKTPDKIMFDSRYLMQTQRKKDASWKNLLSHFKCEKSYQKTNFHNSPAKRSTSNAKNCTHVIIFSHEKWS